jgi:sarcosine oxidase subunit beta
MTAPYDLVVVGGGVMGCSAALRAVEGGMRVAVIEQAALGSGASGVNAGTLSLQIKRLKLMPYALKGYAWWRAAGEAVGFHRVGGLTLAFNAREAELLHERMIPKREAGAPIELISANAVAAQEPGLTRRVVAASWCPADGYANSSRTGMYFRGLLRDAHIEVREHTKAQQIVAEAGGFSIVTADARLHARRLLLAAGGWTQNLAAMLGFHQPIRVRVNTVAVTERAPRLVDAVIGHVTGLLTLKQKQNGTVLIGGGWQGRGTPAEGRGQVVAESLLTNLRLAQFAVPGLGALRVARAWTGFEANVPDFYPLAGAIPGVDNAFILSCVRGGFTIGPYIGRLMGELIVEREPEMPLFDPSRFASQTNSPHIKQDA